MAPGLGTSKAASRLKQLEKTSSLNTFALCDECGRKEQNKLNLVTHLQTCVARRTCDWCNVVFRNRGNLISHITHLHSKDSENTTLKSATANYMCTGCPKGFTQPQNLKYHIRREHFNMIARITEGEKREINEVWVERVLNCDALVEIKKAKLNMFLIKRASSNNTLEISEPSDSIDLTPLYPTNMRKQRVWSDACPVAVCRQQVDKHVREKHDRTKQHECTHCNRKFQRTYLYLQHVCSKGTWRRAKNGKSLYASQ